MLIMKFERGRQIVIYVWQVAASIKCSAERICSSAMIVLSWITSFGWSDMECESMHNALVASIVPSDMLSG